MTNQLPGWLRPHPDDKAFTEGQSIMVNRLCSRCLKPIPENDAPIMFFGEEGKRVWQYHDECLGIKTESFGGVEIETDWEEEEDEKDWEYEDELIPDLGACCACGIDSKVTPVQNLLAIPRRAPQTGNGWGCFVCGLPPSGAQAVVCDRCLQTGAEIKWVIDGYPEDKKRYPYSELSSEVFNHDYSKHRQ